MLLSLLSAVPASIHPGEGYSPSSYAHLHGFAREVCFAHSRQGAAALLGEWRSCKHLVFMGHAPDLDGVHVPALVVAGTRDGVSRISHFAALSRRHRHRHHRFVAIDGAAHHSFASGAPSELCASLDLAAAETPERHHATLRAVITAFVHSNTDAPVFRSAERLFASLADPISAALELEGSEALGGTHCNSDFPTNPSCNYPKYPDFSLPFGPSPPPDPMPPTDCICGSPWVMNVGSPLSAGLAIHPFGLAPADAFHDVSDEHPFHLPHIFNTCDAPSNCTLNVTTVTMPVLKSGDLFPSSANSTPLSAFELKVKFKSRQALWDASGVGGSSASDANLTVCKEINQKAYEWALANAGAAARAAFEAHGEPMVMVDDVAAPIGITGPTWIARELVYTRVAADSSPNAAYNASHITVQSWQFVVGSFPVTSKYIPAGMHYCKLLSPARAMEWIYLDGLRSSLSLAASKRRGE